MKEKILKPFFRGCIVVVMFLCVCILGNGRTVVYAGGLPESDLELNVANKSYVLYQTEEDYYTLKFDKRLKNMRLTCTSSNKKVVLVAGCYENDKLKTFLLFPSKPGKATVTFKAYKKVGKKYKLYKTYKMKITVRKYEKPIKTIKIGNKSVKLTKSKWYDFSDKNWPAKKKMVISSSKDWKIVSVFVWGYGKNIDYAKEIIKKPTSTVKLQRASSWTDASWIIILQNTKTKGQQSITIGYLDEEMYQ